MARRKGLGDVVAECVHQNEKWGRIHDSEHNNGELLHAAKAMLEGKGEMPAKDWGGPLTITRREQLVRAAAFIVAEIDRVDILMDEIDALLSARAKQGGGA